MSSIQFHTNDHQPVAALYACFQCGRITLKIGGHTRASETVANTWDLKDIRAFVSKLKNAINGDRDPLVPTSKSTGIVPAAFPYSDPSF